MLEQTPSVIPAGDASRQPLPSGFKWALAGVAVGHAADYASTVYAVRRGGREGNPLFASASLPTMGAVKGAYTGLLTYALIQSYRHGSTGRKVAWVAAIAHIAVSGIVATRNVRLGQRLTGP